MDKNHSMNITRLLLMLIIFADTNTAIASDKVYKSAWNAVCGIGTKLATGCDKIRKREILTAKDKPWSAIGQVNYAGHRNRQHCTGTLINTQQVITAAHCLYDRKKKQWVNAEGLHFVAGYQRGQYVAHSTVKRYILSNFHIGKTNPNFIPQHDWAILDLNKPIGEISGFIEIGKKEIEENNTKNSISVIGYPSVRRFVLSRGNDCKIKNYNNNSNVLFHTCPIMSGDSGGPIIKFENDSLKLIAVSTGITLVNGEPLSIATTISQQKIISQSN